LRLGFVFVLGPATAEIDGVTYLMGVVSFGKIPLCLNGPVVFAGVRGELDWILKNSDAANYHCE
jgi:hypothetical protein